MIYILPFISALIGWFTNYLAIKMLFHPRKEMNFILFKVQGIFPKRQKKLAEQVGQIVEAELFSIHDIIEKLNRRENLQDVFIIIENRIDQYLHERLFKSMPMLKMFINEELIQKIKGSMLAEFEKMLPEVIAKFSTKLEQEVNVKEMVYEKVANFSSEKLEDILYSIMNKEFQFIEIVGGVLGFIIGLIQLGLVFLIEK